MMSAEKLILLANDTWGLTRRRFGVAVNVATEDWFVPDTEVQLDVLLYRIQKSHEYGTLERDLRWLKQNSGLSHLGEGR